MTKSILDTQGQKVFLSRVDASTVFQVACCFASQQLCDSTSTSCSALTSPGVCITHSIFLCVRTSVIALCTVITSQKHPHVQQQGELINERCYVHTMSSYTTFKNYLSHNGMSFIGIMLTEGSHKRTYISIHLKFLNRSLDPWREKSEQQLPLGGRRREYLTRKGDKETF